MKFWQSGEEKAEKKSILDILGDSESESEIETESEDEIGEEESKPVEEAEEAKAEFNALDCFGWSELKTDKWLIKCAKVWFGIMSLMWFLFGALTFAPVIFISNKVDVIFKHKAKSMVCAILIYAFVIVAFIVLTRARGTVETPVA